MTIRVQPYALQGKFVEASSHFRGAVHLVTVLFATLKKPDEAWGEDADGVAFEPGSDRGTVQSKRSAFAEC